MKTRILVAVPITALVIAAIFVQGWFLALFLVGIALMAQYEVLRAFGSSDRPAVTTVSGGFSVLLAVLFLADYTQTAANSMSWLNAASILCTFVAAVMIALVIALFSTDKPLDRMQSTVFSLAYPALFFACLYCTVQNCHMLLDPRAAYASTVLVLLMLFAPPVLSDTIAYFWGRAFGRRKLCPKISPNKTVAGSVAGLVGGAIAGLLVWGVAYAAGNPYGFVPGTGPVAYVAMGATLAGISQLGDLVASCIKRFAHIKDFGRLLPGHGGVLDRIDSTMFTMPVVTLFAACSWIGLQVT